jgi:hypothetical protein
MNNLNRTICPGCGTENPTNTINRGAFSCQQCSWESDSDLPTVAGIVAGGYEQCNDVNLTEFLKTLFKP